MKTFIKALSIAALFAVASVASAAQKLAVVNIQQVLVSLPQFAVINDNINAEFADQIKEFQRLQNDGNFLIEKLQREQATMSPEEIKKLEQEVLALRQQIQTKGQPLQTSIQRRTDEEQRKLLGLIQQAIQSIAKDEGYDMVLSVAAVPYFSEKDDISQRVQDQVSKIK